MSFEQAKNIFTKLRAEKAAILTEESENLLAPELKEESLARSLSDSLQTIDCDLRNRIHCELYGYGPLTPLIEDQSVTEILINQYNQIYFERAGKLFRSEDHFFDSNSYKDFIQKLCDDCHTYINSEKPFIETQLNNLRITVMFPELCRGEYLVSIRKQPSTPWTFDYLATHNWASECEIKKFKELIKNKKNFLIVGGTGSGKTSVLQACLHEVKSDRTIIVEDTQELNPVYQQNTSLLTRVDPTKKLIDITMNDLIKKTLRLRPDRICVGEIRGEEATALLMALSTGHDGSFGSIHARNAHEALLRLEMLVQMGAPQWSLLSIRRLIGLTLQNIIVVEKQNGIRKLKGLFELGSVEDHGITLQQLEF